MKFSEDDIPKSIFFDLLMENRCFCFSYSEPIAIFFDKLRSIPFSYPVPEIISEHGSDNGTYDRTCDMVLTPETPNKDHHIHPWNSGTNNGK